MLPVGLLPVLVLVAHAHAHRLVSGFSHARARTPPLRGVRARARMTFRTRNVGFLVLQIYQSERILIVERINHERHDFG